MSHRRSKVHAKKTALTQKKKWKGQKVWRVQKRKRGLGKSE